MIIPALGRELRVGDLLLFESLAVAEVLSLERGSYWFRVAPDGSAIKKEGKCRSLYTDFEYPFCRSAKDNWWVGSLQASVMTEASAFEERIKLLRIK